MFSLRYYRHTEGTAGLAGIIGTSQALQHGIIPPNMHFNTLHDRVKPFYTHLKVPTEATNWPIPVPGQPRRASVNSFGKTSLFFQYIPYIVMLSAQNLA
jgi:hybrid polyketide synthase/nonribosomal peptide synthetase ACE1